MVRVLKILGAALIITPGWFVLASGAFLNAATSAHSPVSEWVTQKAILYPHTISVARPGDPLLDGALEKTLDRYEDLIIEVAEQEGVSWAVLAIKVTIESSGNPRAVSESFAYGLTQIKPASAEEVGITIADTENPVELFDPRTSLIAGARYLKRIERDFGYEDFAEQFLAYNVGPGTGIKKYLAKHGTAEGQAHVQKAYYVRMRLAEMGYDV